MNDFLLDYFSHLDQSSCVYFLIISGIFFVLLIITMVSYIIWVMKYYKQLNFRIFTGGLLMAFNLFIAYFVNRLLYTMCNKSFD
jgi:hypothetical protein